MSLGSVVLGENEWLLRRGELALRECRWTLATTLPGAEDEVEWEFSLLSPVLIILAFPAPCELVKCRQKEAFTTIQGKPQGLGCLFLRGLEFHTGMGETGGMAVGERQEQEAGEG